MCTGGERATAGDAAPCRRARCVFDPSGKAHQGCAPDTGSWVLWARLWWQARQHSFLAWPPPPSRQRWRRPGSRGALSAGVEEAETRGVTMAEEYAPVFGVASGRPTTRSRSRTLGRSLL